jgi:hypothetical protein
VLHSGAGDFNFLELDARDLVYGTKLYEHLAAPPILAKRKIIVVNCADQMKEDVRKGLREYLEGPAEEDLLLMLFNTPHTRRDEDLVSYEKLIIVQ